MRCQKGVLRQIHRGNSVLLSLLLYRLQRTELVARKTFMLSKIGPEFSDSKRRASGGVLQCRAIVPNSSTRRASGGVFGFSAVSSNRLLWPQAPIDWGQSIYHFDAQAAVSSGFRLLASTDSNARRFPRQETRVDGRRTDHEGLPKLVGLHMIST